jgi:hypothetical protein
MRGVILKTVSKCTDTTTDTQYGHAAVWALVFFYETSNWRQRSK